MALPHSSADEPLPRPAVCSLVALSSVLFIYDRIDETVVLVLPLVSFVSRLQTEKGRSRWWFVTGSIAVLLVWFWSALGMKSLTEASLNWGVWAVSSRQR
jgi:hypothetical protein